MVSIRADMQPVGPAGLNHTPGVRQERHSASADVVDKSVWLAPLEQGVSSRPLPRVKHTRVDLSNPREVLAQNFKTPSQCRT
ncbi:hypothetical protein CGRA01v4_05942 [Colletotrichum graminicola]|nr:hypothetical protein CGRA01v4_05942 [Colletotrichum graminicola]